MIGKKPLYIGKNQSKARHRQINVVYSRCSCAVSWWCNSRKMLQLLLSLKLDKFKLLYQYQYFFFLKNGKSTINWVSYKDTVPERRYSQSDKMWNQGGFINSNFPNLVKKLEVQPRLILKKPIFPSFLNWESWEVH